MPSTKLYLVGQVLYLITALWSKGFFCPIIQLNLGLLYDHLVSPKIWLGRLLYQFFLHATRPMCLTFETFSCLSTCSFPFYIKMLSMLEGGLSKYRVLSEYICYTDVNKSFYGPGSFMMRRHAALVYYLWPLVYWSNVVPWLATPSCQAAWRQHSRPRHIQSCQISANKTVLALKLKTFKPCTKYDCDSVYFYWFYHLVG